MATIQEKNPHKSLVEVRNTIEVVTECTRKQAAAIANNLTHAQCDAIVKADGDKAKVEAAIKPVVEAKPEPAKVEDKTTKGK
ncbi:hypothetical protein [Gimesia maris]|uniref:hypothetical protein n=1 Tax=Gimesia maris TaxID=122 RepID=UPI0032F03E2F